MQLKSIAYFLLTTSSAGLDKMGIVWHQARNHAEDKSKPLNLYFLYCKHNLEPYRDSQCFWTKILHFIDMNSAV